MVIHNTNGRYLKLAWSGATLVVIAFVGTMWANTRELTKDVPECKTQIVQNTKDIQTATQTNIQQDKEIGELKQLHKETLEAFNKFQIENAKQQGEIMLFIKQQSRK